MTALTPVPSLLNPGLPISLTRIRRFAVRNPEMTTMIPYTGLRGFLYNRTYPPVQFTRDPGYGEKFGK
jgi:hypothetical protein